MTASSVPTTDGAAHPGLTEVLTPMQRPPRPSGWSTSLTFGWRSLLKIRHLPEQLFDVTGFPVIMTVMFTYLFGGALAGSPQEYLDYLLPGILSMTVVMITWYTAVAVNTDISSGIFDRFRTLPMWRPSPMVGYLLGDLVRYLIGSAVIIAVGMIMGFRPASFVGTLVGVGLIMVFSFAMSWVWTLFGLLLRSDKAVIAASQLVLFPLTFLSNVFVQPETMPRWLEAAVEANPITHLVAAVRSSMAGEWRMDEIMWVLVASVVMTAVLGPATMWLYNRGKA